MKIYGNAPRVIPKPRTNPVSRSPQVAEKSPATKPTSAAGKKVNLPEGYKIQLGLNQKEQAFFEKLYPKARKEIQKYLQNQNAQPPVKGQIIDVRG